MITVSVCPACCCYRTLSLFAQCIVVAAHCLCLPSVLLLPHTVSVCQRVGVMAHCLCLSSVLLLWHTVSVCPVYCCCRTLSVCPACCCYRTLSLFASVLLPHTVSVIFMQTTYMTGCTGRTPRSTKSAVRISMVWGWGWSCNNIAFSVTRLPSQCLRCCLNEVCVVVQCFYAHAVSVCAFMTRVQYICVQSVCVYGTWHCVDEVCLHCVSCALCVMCTVHL